MALFILSSTISEAVLQPQKSKWLLLMEVGEISGKGQKETFLVDGNILCLGGSVRYVKERVNQDLSNYTPTISIYELYLNKNCLWKEIFSLFFIQGSPEDEKM